MLNFRKRPGKQGRTTSKTTKLPKSVMDRRPLSAAANLKGRQALVPGVDLPHSRNMYHNISVGQLAVLLWHLYRCSVDDTLGYMDAELTLHDLIANNLNAELLLERIDLERLLFAANLADAQGFFWSPDGDNFPQFVSKILNRKEVFDRQWNLILTEEEAQKMKGMTNIARDALPKSGSKKPRIKETE